MDATTMVKTASLVKALRKAFPELSFEVSDDFRWSPDEMTVYYCNDSPENLLHETAHGLLKHIDYDRDINLLKLERDAWTYARDGLGPRFEVEISEDLIEDALDSYRTWLHARSLCPDCMQSGIQNSDNTYLCLGCDKTWRTNDARRCELRRYKIETPTKTPTQ